MGYGNNACGVDALVGKTLTAVEGAEPGNDEITFVCSDGERFRMYHEQGCCESVQINDVTGDVADLVGSPILKAEETSDSYDDEEERDDSSGTWTFYHLRTVKGAVTLRWLGESNGYYSESVDFERVTSADTAI